MSNILGRQDCIDCLRKDLIDLQGAVVEVFTRTGPVRFPSWKFPDKLSCNLDMEELLDQYDFVEGDEEFSQHSHIVLLELVIDRLVLLLQSFSAHAELALGSHKNIIPQNTPGSIGLVAKRYWSNIALLCRVLQNVRQEKSKENGEVSDEKANKHMKQSSSGSRPCTPSRAQDHISTDTRTVSSQTVSSALVPCTACARVQLSLREVSDALVELCQSQGLPSSLLHFLAAVDETLEQGRLSAADVAQWAVEQRRDLGRVGKHLSKMRDSVQPLRESLVALEESREKLRRQLEEERRQYQYGLQEQEAQLRADQSKKEEVANRQHEELKKSIKSLEKKNSKLQAQIDMQSDAIQRLEQVRDELLQSVKAREDDQLVIQKFEEKIQAQDAQLLANQTLLDEECAKYKNACRQHELTQKAMLEKVDMKQKAMLEQMNTLALECEEVQRRLGESEEAKEELQEKLTRMDEEKDQLNSKVTEQQALVAAAQEEKEGLLSQVEEQKSSISQLQEGILEMNHREKLLVAYPELSALTHGPPQSTGDVFKDMEMQLLANSMRIGILEQQNASLCSSLGKLKEKAECGDLKSVSPQRLGVPSLPRAGQGSPAPTAGHNAQSKPRSGGLAGVAGMAGLWGEEVSSAPSLVSGASSSKILHQQTLAIQLPPEEDASRTFARARNAARRRNNNMSRWKK
ncbi:hypothetical protein GJAV_G00031290 [Gymnothorax javanicus]|nr:hypothetical protein GJAV_G00031290 [Gymnothorax javanicus]